MSAGCALTPADRYSTKMASEGASGEHLPPVQTLATAVLGSVDTVRHGVQEKRRLYGVFLIGVALRWCREKEAERQCASISLVKQQRWPAGGWRHCLEKNKGFVLALG